MGCSASKGARGGAPASASSQEVAPGIAGSSGSVAAAATAGGLGKRSGARRTAEKVLAIASKDEHDFESTPREDVAAAGLLAGGQRHTAARPMLQLQRGATGAVHAPDPQFEMQTLGVGDGRASQLRPIGSPAIGSLLARDPNWLSDGRAATLPIAGGHARGAKLLPPLSYGNERPAGGLPALMPLASSPFKPLGAASGTAAAVPSSAALETGSNASTTAGQLGVVTPSLSPPAVGTGTHQAGAATGDAAPMIAPPPAVDQEGGRRSSSSSRGGGGGGNGVDNGSGHGGGGGGGTSINSTSEPLPISDPLQMPAPPADVWGLAHSSKASTVPAEDGQGDPTATAWAAHGAGSAPASACAGAHPPPASVMLESAALVPPSESSAPMAAWAGPGDRRVPATSKRGAWGEGELTAAGTVMLGDSAEAPLHAAVPAAASADDSEDDGSGVFEGPSLRAAWAPPLGSWAPANDGPARQPPASDAIVEDVEDIFAGDGLGVAALPADLAVNLAALERALEEDG